MRHQTRQDQRGTERRVQPGGQDDQPDQPADEAGDEADQHGVLRVGEHDRCVQRRYSSGHDLRRDALECGDQLAEDGAHTEEDHGHGHTELQTLGHRLHQVVADVGRTVPEGGEGFVLPGTDQEEDGEDQVHQHHRQGGGDHGVAQEAQSLRQLQVLSRLRCLGTFATHQFADCSGGDVAGGTEVADGDRIVPGDLAGPGVGECGHGHHEHTEQHCAESDDHPVGVVGGGQDDGDHRGHEEHVVTGEEHVAQRGEAGEEQADHESEDHQPGDLGTELFLCDAGDGFVGGYHAVHAGRALDHDAERFQGVGDQGGAGTDEQEPEGGLDGTAGDLPAGAFHGGQPDGGDDADEERRHREDLVDEELGDIQ